MIRIFFFILLFVTASISGQTGFESYDWNTIPSLKNADTIKSVNGVIISLERRITEVYLNKDDYFEEIYVYHKKLKVESHRSVDDYNKIYVTLNDIIEIISIKARFIAQNGEITELPKESIKQLENLENKGNFKTFAMEGVQLGGEIEYFYVLRKKFDAYGSVYIQEDEPKANVEILFTYPTKLEYLIKSYNNFPDFNKSDSSNGQTYMRANIGYIPALTTEKYAYYEANLMRYEYTLAYNYYSSTLRAYSWSKVSDRLYENFYILTKKELGSLKSILKKIDNNKLEMTVRIRTIENWMKSEISIFEDLAVAPSIDEALKTKQTNKFGAARLMAALYHTADIPFDLVVTSSKESRPFDPDFNGWNYLDVYLIYFPEINQVMVPDDPAYRMGVMPFEYQGEFGLFLHPVSYKNKITTLGYDVKKLPFESYENDADSFLLSLTLNTSQMVLDAKVERYMNGDFARTFQLFWQLADEDRQKKIISSVFNMGNENITINNYSVKDANPSDIGIKTLQWNLELTANSIIETAGNDIIVKIGETIGEQSELYQNSTRQLPVNMDALHKYYRKIEFTIPDGYSIANAEELNMKVEMKSNNKTSCIFTSEYKIKGNILSIISTEYYTEPFYPLSRFEEFRKVINASADFNKKTIILTKD
jgi:hypothetical protein